MPSIDEVVDLEMERDRQTIAALDDVTLVYTMFALNAEMEGMPGWGKTARARRFKRMIFTEIGTRWIPPEIFGAAFNQLMEPEAEQECRDCGEVFPHDEDADRCPACVAKSMGEEDDDA